MARPSPLKSRRRALGLSQDALGRKAGVSQMQISYLEAGKHEPGLRSAVAIAAALGCHAADLWPDAYATAELPIRLPQLAGPETTLRGHERPRQAPKNQGKRKRRAI